jgi:hypothetical protein
MADWLSNWWDFGEWGKLIMRRPSARRLPPQEVKAFPGRRFSLVFG